MAVKTMEQNTGTGLFNAGWHELTISSAAYDTYKAPSRVTKRYVEVHFEGYPETMHLRVYEAVNKETGTEFKIANLFRYACAGIITVLQDPTGKKPVIQYDDEATNLVGTRINAFFYKVPSDDGKEYSRIFDTVAPVEQETEHLTWTADQVTRLKDAAEKNFTRVKGTSNGVPVVNTTTTHTDTADIPF